MLRTFVKQKKAEEMANQGKSKGQKVSSLDKKGNDEDDDDMDSGSEK